MGAGSFDTSISLHAKPLKLFLQNTISLTNAWINPGVNFHNTSRFNGFNTYLMLKNRSYKKNRTRVKY